MLAPISSICEKGNQAVKYSRKERCACRPWDSTYLWRADELPGPFDASRLNSA